MVLIRHSTAPQLETLSQVSKNRKSNNLLTIFFLEGMLSISQTEKLPPKLAVKASLKLKKAAVSRMKRSAADLKMNKVHQDDDYIYPALG